MTSFNWDALMARCEEDCLTDHMSREDIRNAALSYMDKGPDGGGNPYGVLGQCVASNVDKVRRAGR